MTKILLIDDDEGFHNAIKRNLIELGYEVSSAYNGKEGLKLFLDDPPDLVITDIIMPEQDGIGLLADLKKMDLKFPCKIIAISGGGRVVGKDYLDLAENLGAHAVLEKPFSFSELELIIERLFRSSDGTV